MDGFKNSTRVQYMKGGSCDGYAKGGKVKGAAKINKVMGEFKRGELHSGSKKGPEVTSKKQATAIALSEARKAGAKIPMRKFDGGGVFNERGKRATPAEVAAEGRRVANAEREKAVAEMAARTAKRKPPVEGISTRPTDSSGRRITDKELGITPGGVAPKKALPKGVGAMSDLDMQRLKEAAKKPSAAAGAGAAAAGSGVMSAARAAARAAATRFGGQITDAEARMIKDATKKGVPAHSDRPMIRRKTGGLSAMPKGKC